MSVRIYRTVLAMLIATGHPWVIRAQEVSIPDPGLNAAIRETLQKPIGPLTEQDLLSLTNLNARGRNVQSIGGLEAAINLSVLDLQSNSLTSLTVPDGLTHLRRLELGVNQLTNVSLPSDLGNLDTLDIGNNRLGSINLPSNLVGLAHLGLRINQLTSFTLPAGMTNLQNLSLDYNQLTNVTLPADLTRLQSLELYENQLTKVTLPTGLANLVGLHLNGNQLNNLELPGDLTRLSSLDLSDNPLTHLDIPTGLTNLFSLYIKDTGLTNLTLPTNLANLKVLILSSNRLTRLNLPPPLNILTLCDLSGNQLTQFDLPSGLTELNELNLQGNQLGSFTAPAGLTNLHFLNLHDNQLTNLSLPADLNQLLILRAHHNLLPEVRLPVGMTNLFLLELGTNQLTRLDLPADLNRLLLLRLASNPLTELTLPHGLTQLGQIDLQDNQLASLTLPPDMTNVVSLFLEGNPLASLILPEPLAATTLADAVAALQNQGVSVFTYPLAVQLIRVRQPIGAFQFALTGPPGAYGILRSTDLLSWSELRAVTNPLGTVVFTDTEANLFPRNFYRAVRQEPPANMVFIPPNTFTMGSPTNEQDRSMNEGPQTTVTLTHGFWIGKYEVTQEEYLSIMNTNPSNFPGDLSRPVSSVCWDDATNYCAKLTERELAAGRIPPGSRYRLPTEAEWECAARAGTTTRFSYGDDPNYASTTNYAWFLDLSNVILTVRPVGQRLPNPWGLYDMHGNVWEWCQDNYGPLPGGVQVDPTGPVSTLVRDKVMRGGAYDYPNSSCRSAARLFRFPLWPDSDVGFRVVLEIGAE